jgi:hypothetical protein
MLWSVLDGDDSNNDVDGSVINVIVVGNSVSNVDERICVVIFEKCVVDVTEIFNYDKVNLAESVLH